MSSDYSEFLAEAISQMRADGLLVDSILADGGWHRCQVESGRRNQDGSYKIVNSRWPVVFWTNWKHGLQGWHCAKDKKSMTRKERAELEAELARIAEEDRKRRVAAEAEAAKRAAYIWEQAEPANHGHGYLKRKQVLPGPCRQTKGGRLVLPLYDDKGELASLQFIAAEKRGDYSDKLLLKNGRKQGCYCKLPAKPGLEDKPLLIAEGFATAMSLHMATGFETWIAIDCHNLKEVAKLARAKYPERQIMICADYDEPLLPNYPGKGGIGAEKGRKAAEAIGGYFALCPVWEGISKADFNDLACDQGLAKVKEVVEAALANKPEAAKPKIIYRAGELPRLVKEIEASIKGKAWRLNELLVSISRLPEARSYRGLKQAKGTSVISPFDVASLSLLTSKSADWAKIRSSGKGDAEIAINPPKEIIQVFLAAKDDWTLPPLTGLVTCPIIRPDGSILDKPGYDPVTGLYADFDASFCPIATNPDKQAALEALAILKSAIDEFPFKTGVDQAVALAAMLTAVLRPSVKGAPLFAFSAPTPGTGKSALADLIGTIATGKPCAAMDFNRDEAEFKKALIATLLEGSPVTLIDNIVGGLNNSLLNMILSQETISGRILGLSKNAKLATTSLWLATGNNLEICGDLTRRTLLCTLDAETEKPAERIFRRDIYQWSVDHRCELVQAALTILSAYHMAGKPLPDGLKPMNGFNDWSRWVRGALLWLGGADPKESQLEIEAHDPEREGLRSVLQAWYEHFGSEFVTTKDLLNRKVPDGGDVPDTQLALYQALLEAIPHGRELTGRLLGKWLARHNGRVIDWLNLINTGQTRQGLVYWKVIKK